MMEVGDLVTRGGVTHKITGIGPDTKFELSDAEGGVQSGMNPDKYEHATRLKTREFYSKSNPLSSPYLGRESISSSAGRTPAKRGPSPAKTRSVAPSRRGPSPAKTRSVAPAKTRRGPSPAKTRSVAPSRRVPLRGPSPKPSKRPVISSSHRGPSPTTNRRPVAPAPSRGPSPSPSGGVSKLKKGKGIHINTDVTPEKQAQIYTEESKRMIPGGTRQGSFTPDQFRDYKDHTLPNMRYGVNDPRFVTPNKTKHNLVSEDGFTRGKISQIPDFLDPKHKRFVEGEREQTSFTQPIFTVSDVPGGRPGEVREKMALRGIKSKVKADHKRRERASREEATRRAERAMGTDTAVRDSISSRARRQTSTSRASGAERS